MPDHQQAAPARQAGHQRPAAKPPHRQGDSGRRQRRHRGRGHLQRHRQAHPVHLGRRRGLRHGLREPGHLRRRLHPHPDGVLRRHDLRPGHQDRAGAQLVLGLHGPDDHGPVWCGRQVVFHHRGHPQVRLRADVPQRRAADHADDARRGRPVPEPVAQRADGAGGRLLLRRLRRGHAEPVPGQPDGVCRHARGPATQGNVRQAAAQPQERASAHPLLQDQRLRDP